MSLAGTHTTEARPQPKVVAAFIHRSPNRKKQRRAISSSGDTWIHTYIHTYRDTHTRRRISRLVTSRLVQQGLHARPPHRVHCFSFAQACCVRDATRQHPASISPARMPDGRRMARQRSRSVSGTVARILRG